MKLEWMKEEGDGTVGVPTYYYDWTRFNLPLNRQSQASARGGAATAATVEVAAYVNGVERQRGRVLQSQLDEARRILATERFVYVDESNPTFALQIIQYRRFVDEVLTRHSVPVINRALAALGFRPIEFVSSYLSPSSRPFSLFGTEDGTLGQDESIPGISIECEKCELWEKKTGSVATGCACEPDPIRIGGAALVVGGLIWYLMR